MKFQYTTFNKRILIQTIVASAALIGIAATPNIAYADVFENTMDESQKSGIVSQQEDDDGVDKENDNVLEQNSIKDTPIDNGNKNTETVLNLEKENGAGGDANPIDTNLIEDKKLLTSQNQMLNAAANPSVVATDVNGYCRWTLYDNGSLVFKPEDPNAESAELSQLNTAPWLKYASQIETVKFERGVKAGERGFSFKGCYNLTSIDFTNFDTSNVVDMRNMFSGCNKLTSLNLSGFNTSNVTSMTKMFQNCYGLKNLNLNNFNTSNVTDMSYMFDYCSGLSSIDLSSFNTSKVTDMSGMFRNFARDSKATSLDLSSFDTSNVGNMSSMFEGCEKLTGLNLSSFNTSKVANMKSMFKNCLSLTSLNLNNFDTSKVTDMSGMFYYCEKLATIKLGKLFNTSKVETMSGMFGNCHNLTSLDLSGFNTSRTTNMNGMFAYSTKLTELDLSNFDTSKVTNMGTMFAGCSSLTNLDLSNFDTSKATSNMGYMFMNCQNLKTLTLSNKCDFASNANLKESKWVVDATNTIYGDSASMIAANHKSATTPTTYRSFIYEISETAISGVDDTAYTGEAIKPKPTIMLNSQSLAEDTDYKISYSNNTNAGEASATIVGIGDYAGITTKKFNINKANPSVEKTSELFDFSPNTNGNKGASITPKDGVTGVGDVTVEYSLISEDIWKSDIPTTPGTYKVRANITGGDNMDAGAVTNANWQIIIEAKSIDGTKTTITPESNVYIEKPISIDIKIVSSEGELLTEGTDYTIVYTDSNGKEVGANEIINSGVYKATITGKNAYANCKSVVEFTIEKAETNFLEASALAVDGNKITGVNNLMEYSNNRGSTWNSVPDGTTELTNLSPNTYSIRHKGDSNHNPSKPVNLVVEDKKVDPSPNNDKPNISNNPSKQNDTDKPKVIDDKKDKVVDKPKTQNSEAAVTHNMPKSDNKSGTAEVSNTVPETGDNLSRFEILWGVLSSNILVGLGISRALSKRKKNG